MSTAGAGPLRRVISDAADELGCGLKDLTVLAAQNDPFRLDTPAGHRDGAWLAITAQELGLGERRIHLRGLHYMVLGRPKPDRTPYVNDDPHWVWISADAGKAARWLGYLEFDQITDQRNAPPEVRIFTPPEPWSYLTVGPDVTIPAADEFLPRIALEDFTGAQRYKLVFFGEKSSLDDVLAPLAESRQADLYLPTGEISDSQLHQMARVGAEDGRPMVVFCFSDADPAGWQMPISIGRKLQGFKALKYPELEFEVHRVGLTPDQVREYVLPSTPLKPTERRADAWREAMRVDQTEIDALASLRPDLLRQLARDAIAPFYDTSLDRRVAEARRSWLTEAQAVIDREMDAERSDAIRAQAGERLAALQTEIDALNDALRVDVDADDFALPAMVIPAAVLNGRPNGVPLVDSRWGFAKASQRLIASKAYRDVVGGAE